MLLPTSLMALTPLAFHAPLAAVPAPSSTARPLRIQHVMQLDSDAWCSDYDENDGYYSSADYDETGGMEGMSILSPHAARDAILAARESELPDLQELLSEWQEEQALADDGVSAIDQEQMMASWRALVDSKASELVHTRRQLIDQEQALPAYLTGWLVNPASDLDRPPPGGGGEALERAEEEAEAAATQEVLAEAVEEAADDVDSAYVAEWQLQAERARAESARQQRSEAPARPATLFDRWMGGGGDGGGASGRVDLVDTIGIDLGTTNCAVAAVINGEPTILPSPRGERVFPSVISFLDAAAAAADAPELRTPLLLLGPDGRPRATPAGVAPSTRVLIGERARRQHVTNPSSTYASTKRLIGRTATAAELRQLAALDVPHSVTPSTREVLLACPALRRAISPVSLAAELVRELVGQAEGALDRNITSAVVTVPAYFDDSQRCATETACLLAGLERVRLLREPEAAALTFALSQRADTRVMVFDLGGGTFDVSILDVGSGVIEVIASSGDPRLGGNDWDRAIAEWLEDQFVSAHGVPLDGFARRRLLDAAEAAKLELSIAQVTQVEVPFLVDGYGLNVTLSRRKFEALCRPLLLRLVAPMQEAAEMAGITLDESRMGTLVKGKLANAPKRVQQWQQQVAWRWRRMAQRTGNERFGGGVAPRAAPKLGVPISKVLLVGGATRMPSIGRFIKRMTGLKATPSVDPEEAVALGAAVQAGILDGAIEQKLFNPYQHERATAKLGDNVGTMVAGGGDEFRA